LEVAVVVVAAEVAVVVAVVVVVISTSPQIVKSLRCGCPFPFCPQLRQPHCGL